MKFSAHRNSQLLTKDNRELCCPSCFSTDWKAASLIYAEGLSVTGSKTTGGFVAAGRANGHNGLGVGGYGGNIKGTSQTLLSSKASPPNPSGGGGVFIILSLVFFIAFFFNTDNGAAMIILTLLAWGSLLLGVRILTVEGDTFRAAKASYATLRMCTRCGLFYNPGDEPR